jgi:glycosyltransferase involved in cell wall biosynthesis
VCHELADWLVGGGHDVTVVGAGVYRGRARFVQTFPAPQPEGTDQALRIELLHAARAAAAIEDLDLDVVHDHTRLGPVTAVSRSVPTVLTVHSAVSGPDSALTELEAVQRWVLPVAISAAQRDAAPSIRWSATIHNGINVDAFRVTPKEPFLLYLGRLSPHKGVHLAIDAARTVGRRLVLAGGWTVPEERDYVDRVIRPALGEDVVWVGEVGGEEKVELLSRAACLVLPVMWQEPFGLVAVEAMASGTPVVALRAGALPELIVHGRTGMLCDRADELPAAIERACGMDPDACRAHVAAEFDARKMGARYEDLYLRTVDG